MQILHLWRILGFWLFTCTWSRGGKNKIEVQRKIAWGLCCCREEKQLQTWWWEELCPVDNSNFPIILPSSLVPLLTHCWDSFPVAQQASNPRADFMARGYLINSPDSCWQWANFILLTRLGSTEEGAELHVLPGRSSLRLALCQSLWGSHP